MADPRIRLSATDETKAAFDSVDANLQRLGARAAQTSGQTAQALRMLPAQMTDVFTSLASGQAPLTVLIQQGGQLKDTFGGIGPAARAVGGYISALVNPFTVAAAAIGGIAFAAHKGAEETRAFENAVTMTGNAIGVSASQFTTLRDSLAEIAGTKGKAAEVLTEIARNGQITGDSMKAVGEASILMEKATGQAVSKTISQFAELGKSPTEASRKLNEQYNHLTAAVYAQIKALEDQGEKQKAVELATRSLADVTKDRAASVVENVGLIEGAWNGVLGVIKKVASATMDIGRPQSTAQKLALVSGELAAARGQDPNRRSRLPWEKSEAQLLQEQAVLQENLRLENRLAETSAARNEQNRAGVAAVEAVAKMTGDAASKQLRYNEAIKQYREQLATLRREAPDAKDRFGRRLLDDAVVRETEAGLRESILGKQGAARQPRLGNQREIDAAKEYADAFLDFQKIQAEVEAKTNDLSRAQARLVEYLTSPAYQQHNEAMRQIVLQEAYATISKEQGIEAEKERQKAIAASAKAWEEFQKAQSDSEAKALGEVTGRIAQLQTEAQNYGLLESQVAQLTLARLEDMRAAAAAGGENLEHIDRQIEAQRKLIGLIQSKEVRDANKKAADAAAQEWKSTSERIENSLTDALMRGFESGKGFAQNLRDTLKNMFSTLVLRPILQPVSAGITSMLMGGMGGAGAPSLAGGFGVPLNPFAQPSGWSDQGGIAGNLGNLAGISSMFGAGGLGGSLAAGAGWMTGATTLGGSLTAATSLMGTGTAAGAMSGLGMMAGALGPLALGAMAIMALSKKRGGPKQDGWVGVGVEQGGDNSLRSSVQPIVQAYQAQFDQINALLGSANKAEFGLRVSRDPKGTAPTFVSSGAYVNGQFVRQAIDTSVGREDADMQAAIDSQMKQALLAALKHSDLPGELGRFISSITDESQIEAAVARVQKALTEKQSLEEQILMLTTSETEQLARARQKELDAIDETNRALAERRNALQDEKKAADVLAGALQKAADSSRAFNSFILDVNRSVRGYLDQLNSTPQGGLGMEAQKDNAFNAFMRQIGLARTGDRSALQGITGYASQLIEAQTAWTATSQPTQDIIALVKRELANLPQMLSDAEYIAQAIQEAARDQVDATQAVNARVWDASAAVREALLGSADRLFDRFSVLDTSVDGLLSFADLQLALGTVASDQTLRDLITRVDINADGQISKLELLNQSLLGGLLGSAGMIAQQFIQLDSDLNSLLSFTELRTALGPLASDDTIHALIALIDVNADQQISKLEAINASVRESASLAVTPTVTPPVAPNPSVAASAAIVADARWQLAQSDERGGWVTNPLDPWYQQTTVPVSSYDEMLGKLAAQLNDPSLLPSDRSAILGYAAEVWSRLWSRQQIGPVSSFDVGTNRVPRNMLAMVHKDERIVPARDNPYANPYRADPKVDTSRLEALFAQANALLQRVLEVEALGHRGAIDQRAEMLEHTRAAAETARRAAARPIPVTPP